MSHYPQPPYGTGYGSNDHINTAYVPNYSNQYIQPDNSRAQGGQLHMTSNYGAFGYNTAIPAFNAPPVPHAVPPLPIYQGWNQETVPNSPYPNSSNNPQYNGYPPTSHPQYYGAPVQASYQQPPQFPKATEQHDLSEGEFEESVRRTRTPSIAYTPNTYGTNGVLHNENPQRSDYSRDQYRASQHSPESVNNYKSPARNVSLTKRQTSDPYSPQISPIEDDRGHLTPKELEVPNMSSDNATSNTAPAQAVNGSDHHKTHSGNHTFNTPSANHFSDIVDVTKETRQDSKSINGISKASTVHSIVEAKKLAKEAVVTLVSAEIQYQIFVDEGFDQKIIRPLFDELNITSKLPQSNNDDPSTKHHHQYHERLHQSSLPQYRATSATINSSMNLRATSQSKDNPVKDATPPSVEVGPFPSNKPAVDVSTSLNEKERTLQAKMEALRKSREERAQKAAAQKNGKITATAASTSAPESTKQTLEVSQTSEGADPISKPLSTQQPQPNNQVIDQATTAFAMNTPQHSTTIPGLFLSSTASTSALTDNHGMISAPTNINARKRPVAADFDEISSEPRTLKRPFGYSRGEEPFVINISDDEAQSDDDDVAMDLESETNQDSPVQLVSALSLNRASGSQSLPALPSFPTRKQFSPSSSTINTPPIAQSSSRSSMGRPEVLQQKESEIELLKRKIAAAEARQKANKSLSSGTHTPRTSEMNGTELTSTAVDTPPTTSNVEASLAMQHLIGIANDQVEVDQQRLADVESARLAKIEEMKRHEAERVRLRRLEIEAELPLVEDEYQKSQRRLEEMRAEMAKIEATVRKSLEQKQRYNEEMARLGQETEDQLQLQKAKLMKLESATVPSPETRAINSPNGKIFETGPILQLPDRPATSGTDTTTEKHATDQVQSPRSSPPQISSKTDFTQPSDTGERTERLANVAQKSDSVASHGDTDVEDTSSADQALEAALQDAVRADTELHDQEGDINMLDSYAPDPNQLAPDIEDKQESAFSVEKQRSADVAERESDDYEPPEASPLADSPPFSPAPPDEVESNAVDEPIQDVDASSQPKLISDATQTEVTAQNNIMQSNRDSSGNIIQPLENVNEPKTSTWFTPYESPLRQFRAYRFHPEFKKQIPGGLRSLTYSHKIDPNLEFCRFELGGGICNDNTCDLLHFKDIGLPDDVILTALGSPEEFKGERRDEFCAGLKAVLMDLRLRKTRDFEAIASEILAYRNKFLGDTSKVLPLEGVSI